MAVTAAIPNSLKLKAFNGANINLANGGDTVKVMLLTASHTTDIDAQEFIDDVSANEISVTGYTAGGAALASKTATQDNTDDEAQFDAANPEWTITGSVSFRYAVFYKDTGTPATSPIIAIFDMGETLTPVNSTITLTLDAEGYLKVT
jgi:hypothetical protein